MKSHLISRRRFLDAAGLAGAAALLTACGKTASSSGETVELIVFAAASLTETLTAIGETYGAEHPGVTFQFNFDC